MTMTAAVFGCIGVVGSQILATLLITDAYSSVKTVSRRLPNAQSPKLQTVEESDVSKWGGMISSLSPKPSVVFNAVGTTRATAGGIQNQWKIDHDLCIGNAKAAKDAGVKNVRVHFQCRDQRLPLYLRALLEDEGWPGGGHQGARFRACCDPEAGYDPRKGESQGSIPGKHLSKPKQAGTGRPRQARYDRPDRYLDVLRSWVPNS